MFNDLETLFQRWLVWSQTADRSENGWQSDFPDWQQLMSVAETRMSEPPDQELAKAISRCWEIAEESEELLDYARQNIEKCWPAVEAVAEHGGPAARWQAYEAAASAGSRAEPLLRAALADPDEYARRRGALALARLKPDDSREIAERLLREKDPYLRQAAIDFVLSSEDSKLRESAREQLTNDETEHVREAARTRL